LLALAMVADVEAGGDRAERLLRAARELSEAREADDESGQSGRSSGWRRKSAQSSPRPSCSRQFETADMDGSRARGVWRDSWLRSGLWLGIRARGGRRGRFYLLDPAVLTDLATRYTPGALEGVGAAPVSEIRDKR
jgi:hypothetical protein